MSSTVNLGYEGHDYEDRSDTQRILFLSQWWNANFFDYEEQVEQMDKLLGC